MACCLSLPAVSQSRNGVHPHVAQFHSSLTAQAGLHGNPTPEFNWADGVWNNGEAFGWTTYQGNSVQADTGGFFEFDNGMSLQPANDVQVQVGWTQVGSHYEFIGALSPAALGSNPPADAAFKVYAPLSIDPAKTTVIVISLYQTIGPTSKVAQDHSLYPGVNQPYGLLPPPGPNPALIAESSGSAPVQNFNIITAYIVPRVTHRDLTFTIQRALQLERVVQFMLQAPLTSALSPPSQSVPQQNDVTVVAAGGSAGGLSSQLLPMLFPDRFHGATSYSFSGSLRRTVGDQDHNTYVSSLMGFGRPGQAYTRRECFQWISFLRSLKHLSPQGLDYNDASFVTRWFAGLIRRPTYFLMSDEDNVTNGTEWASLFSGSFSNAGSATNPTVANADVYWSRLDKTCHDSNSYVVPGALHTGGNTTVQDLWKAVLYLIPKAEASRLTLGPIPGLFGSLSNDHDPYDHVLARPDLQTRLNQRAFTPAPLVTLDSAWSARHRGCGTWLGHDDSMIVDGGYVYVGSAGGVVTKLEVDAVSGDFKIVAQSQSLGYRASAMDIENGQLVVATYRHLHVLSASTLAPIRDVALDWEHSRPSRLRVVDLYADGNSWIVFSSQNGELVAWDANLTTHFELGEPGIVDFAFGAAPRVSGGSVSLPIYLASDRGRIVKIEFSKASNTAEVIGVSLPFVGNPKDLTVFPSGVGSFSLASLWTRTGAAASDSIRLHSMTNAFNNDNMLTSFQFSDIGNVGRGLLPAGTIVDDLEFVAGGGSFPHDGFLVLHGTKLRYESLCTACTKEVDLSVFAAAGYPLAIEIGDIAAGGSHPDEVVISTESGQVLWMHLDDLWAQTTANLKLLDCRVATWGMTTGPAGNLQVLDQTARRFELSSSSSGPAVLSEAMVPAHILTTIPHPKPFRGLAHVGYTPAGGAVTSTIVSIPPGNIITSVFLQSPISCPVLKLTPTTTLAKPYFFLPPTPGWVPSPPATREWVSLPHSQVFASGFTPFNLGGDTMTLPGSIEYTYWWTGVPIDTITYRNLVRGLHANRSNPVVLDGDIWATSSIQATSGSGAADHLRSVSTDVSMDLQSLRLGVWTAFAESSPRIVVGTSGGSVLVLDPTRTGGGSTSTIVGELDHSSPNQNAGDHGFGGMALCVHEFLADGDPAILFGVSTEHATALSGDMTSALHIYRRLQTGSGLQLDSTIKFDGTIWPKLSGLTGIAVGKLSIPSFPEEQLVLTTLGGDLVIIDIHKSGNTVSLGALRQWDILDGSLGANNSILIRDLDGDGKNELYIAGSLGIRKFTW